MNLIDKLTRLVFIPILARSSFFLQNSRSVKFSWQSWPLCVAALQIVNLWCSQSSCQQAAALCTQGSILTQGGKFLHIFAPFTANTGSSMSSSSIQPIWSSWSTFPLPSAVFEAVPCSMACLLSDYSQLSKPSSFCALLVWDGMAKDITQNI